MKSKKRLLGGVILILIGLGLIFPPFFSILSKYIIVVIGVYLVYVGYTVLINDNCD